MFVANVITRGCRVSSSMHGKGKVIRVQRWYWELVRDEYILLLFRHKAIQREPLKRVTRVNRLPYLADGGIHRKWPDHRNPTLFQMSMA